MLELDKDYSSSIISLSSRLNLERPPKTIYVSELTYCRPRSEEKGPEMVAGIERDRGVKEILKRTKGAERLAELLAKGALSEDELKEAKELAEAVREQQGTRKFIFLPGNGSFVLRKPIIVGGEEYTLVGSPDMIAVALERISYGKYALEPLSVIPIEKKTGSARSDKYKLAVEQASLYAWMMNAKAAVVQMDWTRKNGKRYYTISNDLFFFVPAFSEEMKKKFEEHVLARASAVVSGKWSCSKWPLAAYGYFQVPVLEGNRKDEDKVIGRLFEVGKELMRRSRRLTEFTSPSVARKLVVKTAAEIVELKGVASYEELSAAVSSLAECLKAKGYEVEGMIKVAELRELIKAVKEWSEVKASPAGIVEVTEVPELDEVMEECIEQSVFINIA